MCTAIWISGTTTTPFDMVVLNEMSRFHLALDALKHIPRLRFQAENAIDFFNWKLHDITTTFANIWKICRRSETGNGRQISAIRARLRHGQRDIREGDIHR